MELEEYDRLYALELEHWRFRALRSLLDAALDRFPPPSAGRPRLLDAGCGTGGTALHLSRRADVVGLDRHPRALAGAARRGLTQLVRAGVEAPPFADASFDAVVSVDVLYHRGVPDDAAALAALGRLCRPGGVVLLWLAAYDWLHSAHDVVVHTRRRYTRPRVRALAQEAGLDVAWLTYVHAAVLPAAIAARAVSRRARSPRSDLARAPRWLAAPLAAWLSAEGRLALRLPLPFGLSVFAVLRRPQGA